MYTALLQWLQRIVLVSTGVLIKLCNKEVSMFYWFEPFNAQKFDCKLKDLQNCQNDARNICEEQRTKLKDHKMFSAHGY